MKKSKVNKVEMKKVNLEYTLNKLATVRSAFELVDWGSITNIEVPEKDISSFVMVLMEVERDIEQYVYGENRRNR